MSSSRRISAMGGPNGGTQIHGFYGATTPFERICLPRRPPLLKYLNSRAERYQLKRFGCSAPRQAVYSCATTMTWRFIRASEMVKRLCEVLMNAGALWSAAASEARRRFFFERQRF